MRAATMITSSEKAESSRRAAIPPPYPTVPVSMSEGRQNGAVNGMYLAIDSIFPLPVIGAR